MAFSGFRDSPPSKFERQGAKNRLHNFLRACGVRENFFETVRSYVRSDDEKVNRATIDKLAALHPDWFY
jgi:hypothetical protein